jgi:hypothetical protein
MINTQLISLIKSLTKSEKRYFKLNSSIIKTNTTLLKLFDLIEKDKIYSVSEISKKLKITRRSNLAVIESRLQVLILKHLRGFNANSSQGIELNNLLIEIEILYNKRLFKNCAKLILKGKKMAINYDHYLSLLSLLKWESFIEKEQGKYLLEAQTKLKEIERKENEILINYTRLIQLKHHTFNILLLSKNRAVDELNKEIKDFDKLMSAGFFDENPNYSFDEKIYLLNFKAMYYLSKSNFNKCLDKYIILVDLIENYNRKNILNSIEYFLALNNLLLLQVMNKNFNDYNKTLKKIYSRFNNLPAYKTLLFSITQCYELGIYCEIGEAKKGLNLIPEIERNLKLYDNEAGDISKLLIYLNISIIYLFNKNYSKSIYWLNIFLNDYSIKKNDVTSNIFYYGHLINILVHFEAKNYESIVYLYNQCINNLKKIRPLKQLDIMVLNFIKQNSENPIKSQKEKSNRFNIFKNELIEITKNPEEIVALQFFDFISWAESHISNTDMCDLIKNKQLNP